MQIKTTLDKLDAWIDATGRKLSGKKMVIHSDLVGASLFIALSLVMLALMPSQIKVTEKGSINAQTFPKLLLQIMLVCSVVVFLVDIIKIILKKPSPTTTIDLVTEIRALIILAFLILYLLLLRPLGFIFSSIVFALLMTAYFRIRKVSYYLIGVCAALLIGVLFQYVLHVRLP